MRKKTLKNFLSFLLVLVLTVCTVAALSMVTRAQTDPALPAVEESIPVAELSASVPQQPMVASPWVCVGAFLLMMLLVAVGLGLSLIHILKDGEPGTWRSLSLWLYDEREGTRADMESILNDFVEVVQGPKRVAVVQQKRRGKDGERTVDPLFFMNRLVNIFPELKDELNQEKIAYGQVRYVTLSLIHI